MSERENIAIAGARLKELLASEPYNRKWQVSAPGRDARDSSVHQRKVCDVLARHLWSNGFPDNDTGLQQRIKHQVSRALNGTVLSPSTVELFIEAFGFSEIHASEIRALRAGEAAPRTVVLPRANQELRRAHPPQRNSYQTVSLNEIHTLGPDGIPVRHRTTQGIRALSPLTTYTYRFDTTAAEVTVNWGGTAGSTYAIDIEGLFAVDITLAEPLNKNDTATFEYETRFSYDKPPPREFRRACTRPVESVIMRVQFDSKMLPTHVWWAEWQNLRDAHPVAREQVRLRADRSVHKFVSSFNGIAGFCWEFPTI